jgi:hypothetical protein
MSDWSPIEESALLELIDNAEWMLEGLDKSFWGLIKLSVPEKWVNHPLGDLGGGFWVVAIVGNRCLYYNDIEDGFNVSTFKSWGEIDEYFSNQLKLEELVSSIVSSRFCI